MKQASCFVLAVSALICTLVGAEAVAGGPWARQQFVGHYDALDSGVGELVDCRDRGDQRVSRTVLVYQMIEGVCDDADPAIPCGGRIITVAERCLGDDVATIDPGYFSASLKAPPYPFRTCFNPAGGFECPAAAVVRSGTVVDLQVILGMYEPRDTFSSRSRTLNSRRWVLDGRRIRKATPGVEHISTGATENPNWGCYGRVEKCPVAGVTEER